MRETWEDTAWPTGRNGQTASETGRVSSRAESRGGLTVQPQFLKACEVPNVVGQARDLVVAEVQPNEAGEGPHLRRHGLQTQTR